MSTNNIYVTKTQHYLRVKKPLIERQRRARMNKCLTSLKSLIAELQHDDAIMRMDKAEMLESTIAFMRTSQRITTSAPAKVSMNSFRNGYMNAVNEISRVMASMPGMSVQIGTAVMTHLGREFNRLLQSSSMAKYVPTCTAPMSPASSGYHSDCDVSYVSPVKSCTVSSTAVWRPW